ncbi:IS3 family transposase [Curtobacterium flaccumfaciens]|uniref:IS3 family transposase n=1 Tax=Curtobacterium flaccumfaciens TaxID=2035 RepID=UPI001BDDFB56|nr:IS3 family transposase [Curtobacterium flaccumfaciens]MBT1606483.1 IS3 family transposase [Curtobacterium flaccumfaciens pv. betae]MBT1655957.1 IS3 family transposase [Curtobacterium flaccumfaciens pv. betae]MCS0471727.1 IS3 family transposase [Curtobacterium flaccumfaciens pv. betae]MCS0473482.1 IS3 family transposase [Curtobacterium flaccumfaciens pv. betae]MCS0477829.1 IS3 family transposase [Curtobacterium flaccumfaciens pv. betae]
MVKAYPEEFRRDVIAVARKGETSVRQVAKDFGVSESCLARWLRLADRDDGVPAAASPSVKAIEQAELRDAQKRIRLLEQENEILRRAAAYFARFATPKMIYPLVLELAADGVPVAVTCRVRGFSKQAFYRWRADPVSQRDWEDAHLTNAAIDAHRDDPTFGYRFIADDLIASGHTVSERRVWRLCSQQRLWSLHAKKRGLNRKAGPPVHDDRVRRAFTAPDLDKLWLTDITEHNTAEGKLYLCAIKDACSRRIVGYSISDRMRSSLAVAALQMAVHRRNPAGTVVHSDRGSQFRSKKFVRALGDAGLLGSMGRVGACADNAAMESFFALLQKNVLNRKRWATREELRLAIITWIEATYHRKRRQRGLGKLTPIEYETIINPQVALAA